MIVETADNRFFRVTETGNSDLAHVWDGIEVKRTKAGWQDKRGVRAALVRKAATKIVEA